MLNNTPYRSEPWDTPEVRPGWGHSIFVQCDRYLDRTDENGISLNSYIGIAGVGSDAPSRPAGDQKNGVFGYDRATSKTDISDGLGCTIMFMETLQDNGPWLAGGPSTVRGLDSERQPYLGRDGQYNSSHRTASDSLWRPVATTNVAMADMSVRALCPSISPRVLEALATIAGAEEVADDVW